MGQYYYAVIEINEQKVVYDRKVDGEYTPAKLTEHSWWLNPFVCSLTKLLYDCCMKTLPLAELRG